jgi:two-component system KDP operon response regulator KdpE
MKNGARILVIDDEPQIRRYLQVNLQHKGYAVITAESAEEALQALGHPTPDLIVMDLILPGMGGIELTHQIRSRSGTPILFLSAIGDEAKKIVALEAGADDYVTKPFNMEELLARIRSILRRSAGSRISEPIFSCRDLSVNFDRREVRLQGDIVRLTPTEYDLLKYLIMNADKVLTHRMLLTAIWGPNYSDQVQYLRVFVGQLRKKLEPDPTRPRYLLTDPGVGYRFCTEPENGMAVL